MKPNVAGVTHLQMTFKQQTDGVPPGMNMQTLLSCITYILIIHMESIIRTE